MEPRWEGTAPKGPEALHPASRHGSVDLLHPAGPEVYLS